MDGEVQKRAFAYRWIVFCILALGYFFVYFHRVSSAVVAEDLALAFDASGAALGALASAYFYSYAIIQLPVGLLADSLGPRKTVTVFLFVASFGAVLFGLAGNISVAIAARVLVGFGVAALFVPTLKILSEWFLIREFATLTGILMAIGAFGSLAATTPLAFFSDLFGWRKTFVFIGFITLVISALSWLLVRNRPQDMGWPELTDADASPTVASIGLRQSVKIVISEKHFWLLAAWFFLSYGAIMGYWGLWGGPYVMDIYGMNKSQAGNVLMFVALGLLLGSPFWGWLSDRILISRKPIVVAGTLIFVLPWVVLVVWIENLAVPVLYILSFVIGASGAALSIVVFTVNKELFPREIAGASTGFVNMFPFVGGAVFPPIMGYILDTVGQVNGSYPAYGYQLAFGMCLAAAFLSFLSVCFMKETLKVKDNNGL